MRTRFDPTQVGWRIGRAWEPRARDLWCPWDRTAGVIGPQGSGKTLDLLTPALLAAPGAALVTLTKVDDLLLTITDRSTHKVLWYAHFHYSTDWTTPRAFINARLKTPQEHSLGAAADTTKGLSSAQRVAFHRSEINESQASTLFFNLA